MKLPEQEEKSELKKVLAKKLLGYRVQTPLDSKLLAGIIGK